MDHPNESEQRSLCARVDVEKGFRFGPYPGEDDPYGIGSSWMLLIDAANCHEEANLLAVEEDGKTYYRAITQIPAKAKFLVWHEKDVLMVNPLDALLNSNIDGRFIFQEGKKRGTKVVVDTEQNYSYCIDKNRGTICYYRCTRRSCPGRLHWHRGTFSVARQHDHEGSIAEIEERKLEIKCKRRAQEEDTSLREIFDQESAELAVPGVGSFQKMESAMQKRRKKTHPQTPRDVPSIVKLFQEFPRYAKTKKNEEFFNHIITLPDEEGFILIFISPILSSLLPEVTEYNIDATVKYVPQNFHQLLTVHVAAYDHAFPIIYALMTCRSQSAYAALFDYLIDKFENLKPSVIMIDYDIALQNILLDRFPNATVCWSWFYYGQAIWSKIQHIGLDVYYADVLILKKIIGMVLSFPLLPVESVNRSLKSVRVHVRNIQTSELIKEGLLELLLYVENYWVGIKPEFSVCDEVRRTNNCAECFHSMLRRKCGKDCGIWTYIEKLKEIEEAKSTDLENSKKKGYTAATLRKQKFILHDKKVSTAILYLKEKRYTPLECLSAISTSQCFDSFVDSQRESQQSNQNRQLKNCKGEVLLVENTTRPGGSES